FQIIPNPVEEKFGIETAIQSFQIEIMDINGRLVKRINNPSEVIDVSDLSSGVYLINLITEEGEYQRKIIKS
ncbi:MAG: T9SS type A sorting domain-containing protein, partial [Flavicella sp.]|nr:T9SS type A sorting domain-containing protein [Flavicella sp.]